MTTVDELFNEASFLRHKNAGIDVMQITREEAKAIIRILSQARRNKPLSSVELELFCKITNTFDFGRPVPHHGSGGGGGQILPPVELAEKK